MTKIIENLQQWDEEEKREAAMTPEKTPPVSEGWPTLGPLSTREIFNLAEWAVETRPKLDEFVADIELCIVLNSSSRAATQSRVYRDVAKRLRAILTKEPS